MPAQEIKDIAWNAIVGKIRKGRSILILGPGAYLNDAGKTLQAEFIETLDLPNNPHVQRYYEEDNFFLFKAGGGRAFTSEKLEDFYRAQQPTPFLRQIAKIPFHVTLNITPDKLLTKAFDEEGFKYQFDYYKKLHEPASIQKPSKALPLIYNLLGCIDNEESLIMTHNDLYDYFKSIFSRKSMPDKLKLALKNKEINTFIFLGVPFEKWYMQLLLRELEIHRGQEDFIRYAANASLSKEVQSFCTEQFTIQFVENDVTGFVNTLYQHCEAAGELREKGQASPLEKFKTLVSKGKLNEAIAAFAEYASDTELADEALGMSGRFRRFERKKRNGVIDSRDLPVQENQIAEDFLELLNEAQSL